MIKVFTLILVSFFSHLAFSQEGVSTQIDTDRLNEVMEWVENAKYTLDTNLEDIQRSNPTDQESRYVNVIETILRQSGDKPNEFLMRNILYRTKVVYASLQDIPSSPKRDVLARRVLEDGVSWAQKLYEPDMNLMKLAREGKLTEVLRGTEFAKLGIEWADYMLTLYYMAPTNKVKYQLMVDLMGLLYNDINNDDAVKRVLAPISGAIVAKHQDLQKLSNLTTVEYLNVARDLRRFVEQQLRVAKDALQIQVTNTVLSTTETLDQNHSIVPTRATSARDYAILERIVATCNKHGSNNAYTKYYRDTCMAARPSLKRIEFCQDLGFFTEKADCMARKGVWANYNEESSEHKNIVTACYKYNQDNEHQLDLKKRCLAAMPTVERYNFCDNATKYFSEKADCIERKGVWANY